MIVIETVRDAYSPNEVRTLTLNQLIDELDWYKRMNAAGDEEVVLSFDNGYTFGGITSDRIRMADFNEDETGEEEDY